MAEPGGPFHLLQAGPGRFLCYCRPGGAVYVTDAMEVWAGDLSDCPALECRCPAEEHGAMLRAALGRGAAELSLGPGSATLRLPAGPQCPALALALTPLPAAEARSQLQALLFGMAGCIESLESRLAEGQQQSYCHCFPLQLARSQSWPGSVPESPEYKRWCLGGRMQWCVSVRKHSPVLMASATPASWMWESQTSLF
ncbi:protein PAXX isoform X5 [Pithys albifrons albifrons]|uniref:protein PAXX isoform X5 n=1 Tax=Pithys albifrons albifrons TaxID=3385563 RepID=UPI003A5CF25D